jgi:hypothetical protein
MNAKPLVAVSIALGASAAAIACVLADPPPIVTPLPQEAPAILAGSVSPQLTQILKTLPPCINSPTDCFVVPVRIDPNASVKYRVFIDLDPTGSPTQAPAISEQDDGGVLATTEAGLGIRTFSFSLSQNPQFDPAQCHRITFVIAYDFFPDDFSKPLPIGLGDEATWSYEPVEDCAFYDAGAPPEAGTD